MIRRTLKALDRLNDSLIGDAIGAACLFAIGYALTFLPLIFT